MDMQKEKTKRVSRIGFKTIFKTNFKFLKFLGILQKLIISI